MSEVIPEGWSIESLGSLAGKITSGATPKVDNPRYYGGTVPFLKIDDITSLRGRYVHTAKQFITDQALNETSAKLFPPGTVLTTMYGTIGSTAILSKAMATNQAIAAFIDLQNTTSEYLYQLLTFEAPRLASSASQTTQANISGAVLKEYCVPVPPLPEQKKIATILSSVDDVIEKTRTQIDKLKDLKTGMMQELLTKGIGHTEFKDSVLGKMPKHWNLEPLEALCTDIVDCVNKTAPIVEYATPYRMIRTTNVRDGKIHTEHMRYVTRETYETWSRRSRVQTGDLIFTREAPMGECGLINNPNGLFLGQRTMLYRANPKKLDNNFLLLSMQSNYVQNQIQDLGGGSTTPHLRVPDCGKIIVKAPPFSEQRHISSSVESVVIQLDAQQKKMRCFESLKKALMQDLLTGKIRVKVDNSEVAAA